MQSRGGDEFAAGETGRGAPLPQRRLVAGGIAEEDGLVAALDRSIRDLDDADVHRDPSDDRTAVPTDRHGDGAAQGAHDPLPVPAGHECDAGVGCRAVEVPVRDALAGAEILRRKDRPAEPQRGGGCCGGTGKPEERDGVDGVGRRRVSWIGRSEPGFRQDIDDDIGAVAPGV